MKTMKRTSLVGLLALIALGGYVGCSADGSGRASSDSGSGPNLATGGTYDGGGLGTGTGGLLGYGGDLGELPEEEEDLTAFRAPVATGDYLWFANPESSRVALISAVTLEVQLLTAGFQPTYVASVPRPAGEHSALVLNVGSEDATWFRVKDAVVEQSTFETHAHANRITVSATGKWAVVWSAEGSEELDPTDGLQDITLVRLNGTEVATYRLTVGYRPSQVAFDADEKRAIVVSEPGISILDLEAATPESSSFIDLSAGDGRDVSLTPSGDLALVRRTGEPSIDVVSLDGSGVTSVTLSGPVTDLDLSADGKRAVAVVREKRELSVLALPDIVTSPTTFDTVKVDDELFGSAALTADGKTAALYTTAVESDRVIVVDLAAGDDYLASRVVEVKAPVTTVSTTPDGEHAVALLGAVPGSDNPGSFAVIPLRAPRFPRVVGTLAPVSEVAIGSEYALLTTSNVATEAFEVHLVRMPSLSVDAVRLSSPPLSAGILAERALGYVAQSHPEGRVSILDFENSGARTLTGFELAAKVVE